MVGVTQEVDLGKMDLREEGSALPHLLKIIRNMALILRALNFLSVRYPYSNKMLCAVMLL